MALTVSNLTSGQDATDDADAETASITPSANKLILLTFCSRADAVQPAVLSVAGNGLTWVEVGHRDFDNSGSRRTVFLYRALGATPSSGTVVITWVGIQTAKTWVIDEITGMDATGTNGSGAIVQAVTNQANSATSLTVTLAAFSSVNNATYGGFGNAGEGDLAAGSGFTRTAVQTLSGESGASAEFLATNDTSVDMSNGTMDVGGIAIEIKAAAASLYRSNLLTLGVA